MGVGPFTAWKSSEAHCAGRAGAARDGLGVAASDLAQVKPGSQALLSSIKVEGWLMTKSCDGEERWMFANEVQVQRETGICHG
jgi:hypothetical protein